MLKAKNISTEQKLKVVKTSSVYQKIKTLNIHVSQKAKMIREQFELSLIECKQLF